MVNRIIDITVLDKRNTDYKDKDKDEDIEENDNKDEIGNLKFGQLLF